jgi:hypothetical protein
MVIGEIGERLVTNNECDMATVFASGASVSLRQPGCDSAQPLLTPVS